MAADTIATYKSFVGIARELGRTVVTSAIGNAGATTINLSDPAGFSSTSKVTVYDGASTEVVTASNLTGSVLTVGATANNHTTPGLLVTTVGTASAGPTDYLVVTKCDPFDQQNYADDKGWRGSMVEVYDTVATTRVGTLDLAGDLYCDTAGYLFGGLLGDVVFTGGTPNAHAISALNSAQGQPPSYQITDFNGINARQWGGVQFSDLNLKVSGSGLAVWDAKASAFASGVVATPSSNFSTTRATPGYSGVVTLNGSASADLKTIDLNFKRNVDVIENIDGGPDPARVFDGTVGVTGKATWRVKDDTIRGYYLNNTQPSLDIAWNIGTGAGQLGLTVHGTKVAFKTYKDIRTAAHLAAETDLEFLANTTDVGTSAGFSPVKVTLRNAKPTGSFG